MRCIFDSITGTAGDWSVLGGGSGLSCLVFMASRNCCFSACISFLKLLTASLVIVLICPNSFIFLNRVFFSEVLSPDDWGNCCPLTGNSGGVSGN